MATLEAIVNGVSTTLTGGSPYYLLAEDGVGMAPVRRISEAGPQQHGDSDVDFRLAPRLIRLVLLVNPQTASELNTRRSDAIRLFRPSKTPIKLRWTLDSGSVREIQGHLTGGLTMASDDRSGLLAQKLVAEVRCADPLFYDPNSDGAIFQLGIGTSTWAVPWAVPWNIGVATIGATQSILYKGEFRDFPIVTIVGPITSPKIENLATGDKLDFTGITIGAGTTYTIDCRYGQKTVKDQNGTNKIADLSDDSDLATFSLEASPDVADGVNPFKVSGTGVTTATAIYLQWFNRYLGI